MTIFTFDLKPIEEVITKDQISNIQYHISKKFVPASVIRDINLTRAFVREAKSGTDYKLSMFARSSEIDNFTKNLKSMHVPHTINKKYRGTIWVTLQKNPVKKIPVKTFNTNLLDLPAELTK